MQSRLLRLEHRVKRVKNLLRSVLESVNMRRVRRPYGTFSICPSKQRLEVYSPDDLPPSYRATYWRPNNDAIKAALEKGEAVPGARWPMVRAT
jgi:hypothetical protein